MSKDNVNDKTMKFEIDKEKLSEAGYILRRVFAALKESDLDKGESHGQEEDRRPA